MRRDARETAGRVFSKCRRAARRRTKAVSEVLPEWRMKTENEPARESVVFSADAQRADELALPECLLLSASRDKWNDFGQMLRVEVDYRRTVREGWRRIESFARLLVLGTKQASSGLLQQLAEPLSVENFVARHGQFVISLSNRQSYRELIRITGPEAAKRLLLKAHDIAALNAFQPSSRILQEARATSAFQHALLRGNEEAFAFLSLQRLLKEQNSYSPVNVTSIETNFEISKQVRLPIRFEFGYALERRTPLNVIIGANGVGKTRLLLAIARAATGGNHDENDLRVGYENDGGEDDANPSPDRQNRFRVISYTYETRHWTSLGRRGVDVVRMGIDAVDRKRLTSMIQQVAMKDVDSWFELRSLALVLDKIVNISELFIETSGPGSHAPGLSVNAVSLRDLAQDATPETLSKLTVNQTPFMYSEARGRYSWSSGQLSLLLFCISLFLRTSRGSLILVDEPENHLHPAYITLQMETLVSALMATESRAIVVTHSPFVVREVDRSAVLVLQAEADGLPAVFRPTLQTLGGDVAMIADHVFGDAAISKGFERDIDRVLSQLDGKEALRNRADELEQSLGVDGASYLHKRSEESGLA